MNPEPIPPKTQKVSLHAGLKAANDGIFKVQTPLPSKHAITNKKFKHFASTGTKKKLQKVNQLPLSSKSQKLLKPMTL
jgi:hypothetical protein